MLQIQVLADGATLALTPTDPKGMEFVRTMLEAFQSGEVRLIKADGKTTLSYVSNRRPGIELIGPTEPRFN